MNFRTYKISSIIRLCTVSVVMLIVMGLLWPDNTPEIKPSTTCILAECYPSIILPELGTVVVKQGFREIAKYKMVTNIVFKYEELVGDYQFIVFNKEGDKIGQGKFSL